MLTRLEVSNFKNLINVDIRFGPFTCIAGTNGVGKSNLFDAIRFLSILADLPLDAAVSSMRDEGMKSADLQTLFHKAGDYTSDIMSFAAEMIIPNKGVDDLGQEATATINFLRYELEIKYKEPDNLNPLGSLEIVKEELVPISANKTQANLVFPHSKQFRYSAIKGRTNRVAPFISTIKEDNKYVILLHQDGGRGKPQKRLAAQLPRTVISVTNATEHPTLLLARREMQSWQMLQMEPSALRRPDELNSPAKMEANGAHLPSTLFRLAYQEFRNQSQNLERASFLNEQIVSTKVFNQIARRLNELIEDIRDIFVTKDDVRNNLVLKARLKDGTELPARSLSDGTLRFLALAIIEQDNEATGLLCMEEPENGIHPARIRAMLNLLKDIACDPSKAISDENPLRQVIINTHAPAVVQEVEDDSLVLADTITVRKTHGKKLSSYQILSLSCLNNTWRSKYGMPVIVRGKLLSYLNPVLNVPPDEDDFLSPIDKIKRPIKQRVIDRQDIKQLKINF